MFNAFWIIFWYSSSSNSTSSIIFRLDDTLSVFWEWHAPIISFSSLNFSENRLNKSTFNTMQIWYNKSVSIDWRLKRWYTNVLSLLIIRANWLALKPLFSNSCLIISPISNFIIQNYEIYHEKSFNNRDIIYTKMLNNSCTCKYYTILLYSKHNNLIAMY